MKNLLLVDGSSLLSTSFFGSVPKDYYMTGKTDGLMKTSTGVFTNGVYTMLRVLMNIWDEHQPTHMAVAWDQSRNTFRRERYADYKGHRTDTKPELRSQFGLMQDVLSSLGVFQYSHQNFEADDIIGTLAHRFEDKIPVTILTKDQDALQLVSYNTRVWLNTAKTDEYLALMNLDKKTPYPVPKGYFEMTPDTFELIYGLKPHQMPDKKGLEGDTSDNIPGVKGVGEKAVVPLLQEFGTIENLYAHIEAMDKAEEKAFKELCKELGISRSPLAYLLKTSDSELVGKQAAFLSKELATIERNIPDLETLALDELSVEVKEESLIQVFNELEFKTLLKKIQSDVATTA